LSGNSEKFHRFGWLPTREITSLVTYQLAPLLAIHLTGLVGYQCGVGLQCGVHLTGKVACDTGMASFLPMTVRTADLPGN